MAATPRNLTIHFPVAASPDKIPILLRVLQDTEEPILKKEDLDRIAFDQSSHNNRFDEARILAEQELGLIEATSEGLQATGRSHVILKKREPIQYDLLHYLFYTTWRSEEPANHLKAWFYRVLCENLWSMRDMKLDVHTRQALTQQITDQAQIDFQSLAGFRPETFSLGRQTMAGAVEWLVHLKPQVLEAEQFTRRAACSGELFLLALSHSYQMSGSEAGTDMLLSPQRRDEISRLCLLEPLQFDRMLDWVLPMFPQFLAQGTRAGSYGRFIRLHRFVTLEDLA